MTERAYRPAHLSSLHNLFRAVGPFDTRFTIDCMGEADGRRSADQFWVSYPRDTVDKRLLAAAHLPPTDSKKIQEGTHGIVVFVPGSKTRVLSDPGLNPVRSFYCVTLLLAESGRRVTVSDKPVDHYDGLWLVTNRFTIVRRLDDAEPVPSFAGSVAVPFAHGNVNHLCPNGSRFHLKQMGDAPLDTFLEIADNGVPIILPYAYALEHLKNPPPSLT